MKKIVIGICDDENFWIERIKDYILEYSKISNKDIELKIFHSSEEYLEKNETVDILLLDIEMNGITGIELKDLLAKRMEKEAIIFISCYKSFLMEAFGKNVYGFLEKPIVVKKLFEILDRVVDEKDHLIEILVDNDIYIKSSDIVYIRAIDKYVRIYTNKKEYIGYFSLKESERKLHSFGFKRVQKSFIVNFKHILTISSYIKMDNGFEIPVGRGMIKEVKFDFLNYVSMGARA